MGIASDLRQSVLQAAMQGKLTTQKAENGDARGLLLAIREEKEKLVKEKKIKKEKPLAPITDEEIPFDIPDNWVWCRLNDITVKEIRRGKSPKYSDVRSNTLSFAQKCNTKYDGIQMSLAKYLDESTLKRYTEEDAIIDGDTIINSTGHGTLGRVGFFTDSNNPNHLTIYPDSHVTVVRPSRNCDSRFIHLYIKTQQSWFETKGEGSTNQTELKPAVIKSIVIPLPPLPEQRRIVARIDALMKEIEELEQTEKELEAIKAAFPADMKASLLQAAMEGKLTTQKAEDGDAKDLLLSIREEKEKLVKEKKKKKEKPLAPITDEEIPFDIPDNWVWCRLNDITVKEIRRGKSPKYSDVRSNTLSFAQKCNTKYDGIQMSLAKYLDESTLKRYTEEDAIIDGDTIINSTGHGTLGRVGFFTDSNNPNHLTIYPDSHVTVVRPSRNCDSRFIHLYIKTQQSWFETKGEGSTNQTELKPAVIKSIVIPLPPLPEQQRIVEKLDQLLPLCDSLSEH